MRDIYLGKHKVEIQDGKKLFLDGSRLKVKELRKVMSIIEDKTKTPKYLINRISKLYKIKTGDYIRQRDSITVNYDKDVAKKELSGILTHNNGYAEAIADFNKFSTEV